MLRAEEGPSKPLLSNGGVNGFVEKASGSRRWLLINASGQEMILDANKYEIMDRLQIHPRDLRILDPWFSYPSTILTRERAIILNLEHIKAVITAEEVLIGDPQEGNVVPVIDELRKQLNPDRNQGDHRSSFVTHDDEENGGDEAPFEFRALEVILEAICSYFAECTNELETQLYPTLDMVTAKITSSHLDLIHKLKSQIKRLAARSQKVRDGLEHRLDDDDDMADLYLSRRMVSPPLITSGPIPDIAKMFLVPTSVISMKSGVIKESAAIVPGDENVLDEFEMVLEDYYKRIDETLNKLNTLRDYISNTEDFLRIRLDYHRNQFTQVELVLNAAIVGASIHSCVAGIFSVNIPFTWMRGYAYTFKPIASVPAVFSAIVFTIIVWLARKKGLLGI